MSDGGPESLVDALTAGLLGAEASRRVGWAKAFDALRRIDGLLDDNKRLFNELDAMRNAYSQLVAFTSNLPHPRTEAYTRLLGRHRAAEEVAHRPGPYMEGVRAAKEYEAEVKDWFEAEYGRKREKMELLLWEAGELDAEARQRGHFVCFDSLTPGSYHCFCSCGVNTTTDTVKAAFVWCDGHRVDVVHGVDLATFRKMRKNSQKERKARRAAAREAAEETG